MLVPQPSKLALHEDKFIDLSDVAVLHTKTRKFSKIFQPEMALMAGVMDYFLSHGLEHQPESLHYDVATCVGELIDKYLELIYHINKLCWYFFNCNL